MVIAISLLDINQISEEEKTGHTYLQNGKSINIYYKK